jgi:hypothetical protein
LPAPVRLPIPAALQVADPARGMALPAGQTAGRLAEALLRQRQRFVVLTGAEGAAAAAIIQSLGAELGPYTRVVRVANPLVSPLTVSRILLQLGGYPANSVEEDAAGAVCLLTTQVGPERQVLLVVENADTLDASALQFLQELPDLAPAGAPALQVLVIAGPRFAAGQAGDREPGARPVCLEVAGTAPDNTAAASRSARGTRFALPITGFMLLAGIAGASLYRQGWGPEPSKQGGPDPAVLIAPAGNDQAAATEPENLPEGIRGSPPIADLGNPAETPALDPPPGVSADTVEQPDRLRQEFDTFLSVSGPKYVKLTKAQRDLLFQQYLARPHQTQAFEPPAR